MAARPLDRLGHQRVESHVLGHVRAGCVVARELDHVADQRGELLGLLHHVVEQRARAGAGGSPSPSRSTSAFVRSAVTGVRSSCEASATSWRCAARRGLEPLERRAVAGGGAPPEHRGQRRARQAQQREHERAAAPARGRRPPASARAARRRAPTRAR